MPFPTPQPESAILNAIVQMRQSLSSYRSSEFADPVKFIEHLASFGDFTVFLPVVCNSRLRLELPLPENEDDLYSFGVTLFSAVLQATRRVQRRYKPTRLISRSCPMFYPEDSIPPDHIVSPYGPDWSLDDETATLGRMSSNFFIGTLPKDTPWFDCVANVVKREKHTIDGFNSLPKHRQYAQGIEDVVEFYIMRGKILSYRESCGAPRMTAKQLREKTRQDNAGMGETEANA